MNRVLIVDDDDQVRRALTQTLERHGFECVTAASACAGMDIVRSAAPDVILLNASLGAESGLDMQRLVRGMGRVAPAVVFITGRRDLFGAMAEQLGPADDWLGKPWDPSELAARVRVAMARAARS
jgi:two-component system OmpR family response regulator